MARYIPGNVADPQLAEELAKIAQAMETASEFALLTKLYAQPKKIREGMEVLADGTSWDPGSGEGRYCYYGSAWHFLG